LQSQDLYIIIPVFDHDEHLKDILSILTRKGYHNIIVINDGSEKAVLPRIDEYPIHYLHHRQNLGQGAALQTGFDYATRLNAAWVVTFDADGQHDPDDIESVIAPVKAGQADVCLGSRFLSSQPTNMPFSKKLLLYSARFFNFMFTGVKLTDAHNGLRALNRKALNKIRITENRMAHATEILIEAKKYHLRIEEVPVTIHYTDYSIKHGQSSWNSLRIFIDLVFYKLFS
jgi:glycosyltransferase involved in cell wall biosynthesis